MVEEIEGDLHVTWPIRNERGREPTRVDVERRVPGMVYPRRLSEPIFADDLRVEMQCGACLAPRFVRDIGPHGAHAFLSMAVTFP
jgi:hypothetical protein